ncbi:MAG TPA: hypothetical protein VMM18_12000 [Gemmatimonadaceae bacterium]|nr:hypothetical protein [Gemmatimonadaceae bacterium]
MATRSTYVVPILALLGAMACGDGATAPGEDLALDPVELSLDAMQRGEAAPRSEDAQIPTLQRLLHQAIERVRSEQGDQAARRLLAPIHQLLVEAREARLRGDLATARQKLHEANLHAARIIVHVFGPQVASRLAAAVESGLAELEAIIAAREEAGEDVTALRRAAHAIGVRHAEMERAIALRAYPRAVLLGAHALDFLRRIIAGAGGR